MATTTTVSWRAGLVVAALVVAGCSDGAGDDAARVATDPTTGSDAPAVSVVEPVDTGGSVDTETSVDTGASVDDGDPVGTPPADGVADWTLLVYVMGDNDLEPFALDDLVEMTEVGSSDQVNLVALADRHPDYDVEGDPFGDFEGTRLFFVEPGELVDMTDEGELNVGAAETLAGFVEFGMSSFPADRYGVILWDHGAGWPGMGPDETNGDDLLELAEIDAGLEAGLDAVGVDRLDLIGFDACLMASYDVAGAMHDHAEYMLASEELEPGHGWNYEVLQALIADPSLGPAELGTLIIDGFAEQAAAFGTSDDITLSLLDLGGLPALQDELAGLAEQLAAEPARTAPLLARAQSDALKFGASPDPTVDSHHVDLGQVVDTLAADPVLAEAAIGVRSALDDVVVHRTSGPATASATGLSAYFPPYDALADPRYLEVAEETTIPVWPDVLTGFYAAGSQIPSDAQPAFENVDGAADYFFDEDGLNIFGTFDIAAQDNVVEAEVVYGVLDEGDGSIIFIGEEPGEVSTDGSGLAAAIYDLTVLTISDGIDTDYAYLDLAIDEELGVVTIDVPLWYVPPEEFATDDPPHDVVLSLVLDLDFEILSEVYYVVQPDGTFGELNADPDGLIFPVLLNEYPDGSREWVTLSEQGLYANLPDLQYDVEPLEPGTGLYAELVLRDYGGNVSAVSMFDIVP